jgi:hypothetical protein
VLSSTAGGQLQSQHGIYHANNNAANKTKHTQREQDKRGKKRKNDKTRFLKLKYELLKISTNLQTDFAAETHLAAGQWLEEQLNIQTYRMFRVGTRKPTASRTGVQDLM